MSVLMSVFDPAPEHLDAAVKSILGQTFEEFEFVIIDDGSGYDTRRILESYAVQDARIRLTRLPRNIGLTRALNEGLKRVRGTLIARQDADDVSYPTRLERYEAFFRSNVDVAAAGCSVDLVDSKGNLTGKAGLGPLDLLETRNVLVHGSMVFRRAVFELAGPYEERMRLAQDYELYLRMTRMYGMRIGLLPDTLYALRQHSESLSSRKMFRQFYFSVLAKVLTSSRSRSLWRMRVDLAWRLFIDFTITNRLLAGPMMRRGIRFLRNMVPWSGRSA